MDFDKFVLCKGHTCEAWIHEPNQNLVTVLLPGTLIYITQSTYPVFQPPAFGYLLPTCTKLMVL